MAKDLDYQTAKNNFLQQLTLKCFERKTLEAYGYILDHLFSFLKERDRLDIKNVTKQDLKSYEAFLVESFKSPATQKTYLRRIFFFFRFLTQEGFLLIDPSESLSCDSKINSRRLPEILTASEIKSLLNFPFELSLLGLRDRAILELIYSSGLRVSEVAALKVGDIDFHEKVIFVCQGKGRKDRVVPLGERARVAIQKYLEVLRPTIHYPPSTILFLSYTGGPLEKTSLAWMIRKYARLCGLKKRIYPHLLRHTMATHLLEGGASLSAVQGMLGHSRLETTQLYTQVRPQELKRWVEKCHPTRLWRFRDHGPLGRDPWN